MSSQLSEKLPRLKLNQCGYESAFKQTSSRSVSNLSGTSPHRNMFPLYTQKNYFKIDSNKLRRKSQNYDQYETQYTFKTCKVSLAFIRMQVKKSTEEARTLMIRTQGILDQYFNVKRKMDEFNKQMSIQYSYLINKQQLKLKNKNK